MPWLHNYHVTKPYKHHLDLMITSSVYCVSNILQHTVNYEIHDSRVLFGELASVLSGIILLKSEEVQVTSGDRDIDMIHPSAHVRMVAATVIHTGNKCPASLAAHATFGPIQSVKIWAMTTVKRFTFHLYRVAWVSIQLALWR